MCRKTNQSSPVLAGTAVIALLLLNGGALAQSKGEPGSSTLASAQEKPADLYSTIMIAADLQDATQAMTIHDPDEDGFIDKDEQRKLSWRSEVKEYDLNKDGKLTHLEVAIRFAKERSKDGVTQFDRNNAQRFMRRKDRNGNGQLDPDEIAQGWPANPEEMDRNGDGIITLSEMATRFAYNRGYRRFVGIETVDQTEAIRLRNQYDADKDGKLSADEAPSQFLPAKLSDIDENDDDLLTLDELATGLARHRLELGLSTSDQAQARSLIRMSDFNQDGMVTREEMAEAPTSSNTKEFFEDYDTNSDGTVTMLEVEKLFAQRRKTKGYSDEDYTNAARLMTRHDRNRSTFVEKNELLDLPRPGQLSTPQMAKIDTNKDEKLSIDEIAKFLATEKKKAN